MPSSVAFHIFSLTSFWLHVSLIFFDFLWLSLYLHAGKASPRPGRSRQWELAIKLDGHQQRPWWGHKLLIEIACSTPTVTALTAVKSSDCIWRMQNKSFCAFCRVLALYFSKFLAPLLQLQGSHLCARAFRKKDVVPKLLLLAPDRFPALAHHGFTSTLGSGKWIPSLSHYTACTKPARCLVGWMKDVHCKVASAWHLLQKTCHEIAFCKERTCWNQSIM